MKYPLHLRAKDDYFTLIKAVMDQAVTDYIKMQYPAWRLGNENEFSSSIQMFFDAEYELEFIPNDIGKPQRVKDLVFSITGEKANISLAANWLLEKSKEYWLEKKIDFFSIPEFISIGGKAFYIILSTESRCNDEELHIYLNKNARDLQEELLNVVVEYIVASQGIMLDDAGLEKLKESFYLFHKINSIGPK